MQALGHSDGGFGVGRAFHVDSDEGVYLGGVLDHLGDDAFGEGGVEIHADLGEFDADVGVEFARFGFGGDAFAERVEGGGDAFAVDAVAAGEDVVDGHAGDEAAGEFAADGGTLREGTHGFVLRESDKSRSKQTVIPLTPPGWRTGGIVSRTGHAGRGEHSEGSILIRRVGGFIA